MIDNKRKIGHLTDEIKKQAEDDSTLKTWRSKNSLVIVWLVNFMESVIGKTYPFLPTVKKVWEAI